MIEEIKESISKRGKGDIFVGFEETLLSSLEKAETELRRIKLGMDDPVEVVKTLKERVKELEDHHEISKQCEEDLLKEKIDLQSRLKDLEAKNQIYLQDIQHEQALSTEINERLKELREAMEKHREAKMRIKELEAQLASIKAFPSIGKLEVDGELNE